MTNKYELIMVGVAISVCVLAIYLTYSGWKECSDLGGVYLRAAFWYECVHFPVLK